jgi:hypothetical protein
MLEAAARVTPSPEMDKPLRASAPSMRNQNLAAVYQMARGAHIDPAATWRLDMIARLSGLSPEKLAQAPGNSADAAASMRMMLPVSVGSTQQASMLAPLLAVHGLAAQAAPVAASAKAPGWIDGNKVRIQPGGVFAVPLTFGPMELAAIGTTTEVLPDGTALAFGHQFFAQGPIAVPMAPGFVHFVQPNLQASFKLGGSLGVAGALVRDEATAVIGKPDATFPTVPATIHVRWPDSPQLDQDLTYTIVHHEQLLPALVGAVASASLVSNTELPQLNTMEIEADIAFTNGRSLRFRELAPNAVGANVVASLVPPIAALIENDFTSLKVKSIKATVTVRRQVLSANILSATIDQSTVAPGDKVTAHIRLMPFRGKPEVRDIQLTIPRDTPDGQYILTLGGSRAYAQQLVSIRPHLLSAENDRELFDAVQQIIGAPDNALYGMLALAPGNNLAIGRSELPRLPGSRLALLQVETSTRTTPYLESVETSVPLPFIIANEMMLPVTVEKDAAHAPGHSPD